MDFKKIKNENLEKLKQAKEKNRNITIEDLTKVNGVGVIVLIEDRDEKYILTGRRKDTGDCGLPGGKIEKGEKPIDAARRELKEEFNLDLPKENFELCAVCQDGKSEGIQILFVIEIDYNSDVLLDLKPQEEEIFDITLVPERNLLFKEWFTPSLYSLLAYYSYDKLIEIDF